MGVSQNSVCLFGVPRIRTVIYWSLHWGPPILGNLHISRKQAGSRKACGSRHVQDIITIVFLDVVSISLLYKPEDSLFSTLVIRPALQANFPRSIVPAANPSLGQTEKPLHHADHITPVFQTYSPPLLGRTWLWVCYDKLRKYPVFYLLTWDYRPESS